MQLMHYALDAETGKRVHVDEAMRKSKGGHYICECCGKEVIPNQGSIKQHVFSHATGECSDKWVVEEQLPWHIDMQTWFKKHFPEAEPECVVKKNGIHHRADVFIPAKSPKQKNVVVELQHSAMKASEFAERNEFYIGAGCYVIWIFDKIDAYLQGNVCTVCDTSKWKDYDGSFNPLHYYGYFMNTLYGFEDVKQNLLVLFQKRQATDDLSEEIFERVGRVSGSNFATTDELTTPQALFDFINEQDKIFWDMSAIDIPHTQYDIVKNPNNNTDSDEEPDEKPELDEARCKDTTNNRLLELANMEDDGSIGKYLCKNQKIQGNKQLRNNIFDRLKTHLRYQSAEAIVSSADPNRDADIIQYIYEWSLLHEYDCIKQKFPSKLRYYIAIKSENTETLQTLSENYGDGIRIAVAQNMHTSVQTLNALFGDKSSDVACAAMRANPAAYYKWQTRQNVEHQKSLAKQKSEHIEECDSIRKEAAENEEKLKAEIQSKTDALENKDYQLRIAQQEVKNQEAKCHSLEYSKRILQEKHDSLTNTIDEVKSSLTGTTLYKLLDEYEEKEYTLLAFNPNKQLIYRFDNPRRGAEGAILKLNKGFRTFSKATYAPFDSECRDTNWYAITYAEKSKLLDCAHTAMESMITLMQTRLENIS